METLKEFIDFLSHGGDLALWGLGIFLGYKLAFTTVISMSVVNVVKKLINYYQSRAENDQKLIQLAAKAGMTWPLSIEEWTELNNRVKK